MYPNLSPNNGLCWCPLGKLSYLGLEQLYDDTYFISSYAKLCVYYGMFLYIRVQYVPGVWPNMSRGTQDPCGTRCWSSFIFHNSRSTMSEQITWWHRSPKNARHVFMYSSDQYFKNTPGAVQYCGIGVDYLSKTKFPPSCSDITSVGIAEPHKILNHKF